MEKEDDKLFKRDICCFDFRSNFLVSFLFCSILERKDDKSFKRDIIVLISFPFLLFSASFLVNIGKEMSLPEFHTSELVILLRRIFLFLQKCVCSHVLSSKQLLK